MPKYFYAVGIISCPYVRPKLDFNWWPDLLKTSIAVFDILTSNSQVELYSKTVFISF